MDIPTKYGMQQERQQNIKFLYDIYHDKRKTLNGKFNWYTHHNLNVSHTFTHS